MVSNIKNISTAIAISFSFFVVALQLGCGFNNSQAIRKVNYADDNLKQVLDLEPKLKLYHHHPDSVTLFIKLNSDQLLFSKNLNSDSIYAKIKILAIRFMSRDNLTPKDSTIKNFVVLLNKYESQIELQLKLSAYFKNETPYKIIITDLVRNNSNSNFIISDKTNTYNYQNYMAYTSENKLLYKSIMPKNKILKISKNSNPTHLYVRYLKGEYNMALPPFSINNPQPLRYFFDSSFKLNSNANHFNLNTTRNGIYHIMEDTNKKEGLSIYQFQNTYPTITDAKDAIFPMRYILSKQEFEDLTSANNAKEALDNIWLKIGGNTNKSKELISNYYNRVKYSNEHFTSHIEGWRSDRGMMYIVLGEPLTIYKSIESETWIYGEEANINAMSFVFNKIQNPFTDNDYSLSRNPLYKDYWYLAVDTWRNGRIFKGQ